MGSVLEVVLSYLALVAESVVIIALSVIIRLAATVVTALTHGVAEAFGVTGVPIVAFHNEWSVAVTETHVLFPQFVLLFICGAAALRCYRAYSGGYLSALRAVATGVLAPALTIHILNLLTVTFSASIASLSEAFEELFQVGFFGHFGYLMRIALISVLTVHPTETFPILLSCSIQLVPLQISISLMYLVRALLWLFVAVGCPVLGVRAVLDVAGWDFSQLANTLASWGRILLTVVIVMVVAKAVLVSIQVASVQNAQLLYRHAERPVLGDLITGYVHALRSDGVIPRDENINEWPQKGGCGGPAKTACDEMIGRQALFTAISLFLPILGLWGILGGYGVPGVIGVFSPEGTKREKQKKAASDGDRASEKTGQSEEGL